VTTGLIVGLCVLAVGATLQGSLGFGMNLVAAPVMAAADPRFVPGPLLVAAALMTLLVLLREHRSVSVRQVGWAFAGRVPGAVAGAAAVAALQVDTLSLVLAVVVLLAVVVSVAGVHVPVSRRSLVVAGAVSGFTGTTTAVGGPPMALLYQHGEGGEVRGNLSGFFLLGVLLSIALLVATGSFGWEQARLGALTSVPVIAGFTLSGWTRRHVDGPRLRPAVLAVAALSATVLLVRTLAG
jgi:uncharacterized membrane protein YfcA